MSKSIIRRDFLLKTVTASAVTAIGFHVPFPSSAKETKQKVHHINIKDFEFSPSELMVRPGDRIIWTNLDIAPHTATATDKTWDSKMMKKSEKDKNLDILTKPKIRIRLITETL